MTREGKSQYFDGIHAVPWSEVDKEVKRWKRRVTHWTNSQSPERVQKNEEDRQSWEAGWDISEDTVSTSSWDAIEGHSEKLKRVKDGSGVGKLQETQDKENEVHERKERNGCTYFSEAPKEDSGCPGLSQGTHRLTSD